MRIADNGNIEATTDGKYRCGGCGFQSSTAGGVHAHQTAKGTTMACRPFSRVECVCRRESDGTVAEHSSSCPEWMN